MSLYVNFFYYIWNFKSIDMRARTKDFILI